MKKRSPKRTLSKTGKLEPQTHHPSQPQGLVKFFAESPLANAKINFKRKRDLGRKIEL
jgi:hypothetical protein